MVSASLLFLIPGVESCQGKALRAKPQLTFLCILPCRAQMVRFPQPLPFFSSKPQLHVCKYYKKISLPFPTLSMETSLCSLSQIVSFELPTKFKPSSMFSQMIPKQTPKQIKQHPIQPGLSAVHSSYASPDSLQKEQLGYFFARQLIITD